MEIRVLDGGFTKNKYIGEELPKKEGLGQFTDLSGDGGLPRKKGVAFFGGVDTPMHTMAPLCPFWLPPQEEGESEKLKKGGGSMVQGQVFLKGGGQHFSYLIFSKVYHFCIQKLLYSLQNCVVHLKKNYFFLPP